MGQYLNCTECDTHAQAYGQYLQSGSAPPSLAEDIHRLEAAERERHDSGDEVIM